MQLTSPFKIGITPKEGQQYVNELKVGNTELVVNTTIEDAVDVQRIGTVISLPFHYQGELKVGDDVVIHHNVFRITYNDKGIPMQSDFHFKDEVFFIPEDLIYMYIRDGRINAYNDNVFIEPIHYEDYWEGPKFLERQGVVKFTNEKLSNIGVLENTKIHFRKFCEYSFYIFGMHLYKMKNDRILAILE